MKKVAFLLVCVAVTLVSCDGLKGGKKQLQAENDSLLLELSIRNTELDEMMTTFNEVQEGFRQINQAADRVDLERGNIGENATSAREQITSDIAFITKQMQENKALIEKLQKMVKTSKHASAELKRTVASLTEELAAKQQQIAEMQAELAAKNIRIRELDEMVGALSKDRESLTAENEAKAKTVAEQDKLINSAWYVFGTKDELKAQNILSRSGLFKKEEIMSNGEINKEYFTKIDIRTTKQINLYSRSAELLTMHPESSYELVKDEKKQVSLKITDPKAFWSISKFLVIKIK